MKLRSSWLDDRLEVRDSKRHGKGVFSKTDIPKDVRLAIFGGDIMYIDELNNIPDELSSYAMQIEERFVLGYRDPFPTEDTDYFNHSCNPNAGFKGQIFLVSMRPILINEEVTFDYAMVLSPSVGSDIVAELDCTCGAPNCRKIITEQDWQLPELRKRYKGFFSQYLEDKINSEYSKKRK